MRCCEEDGSLESLNRHKGKAALIKEVERQTRYKIVNKVRQRSALVDNLTLELVGRWESMWIRT